MKGNDFSLVPAAIRGAAGSVQLRCMVLHVLVCVWWTIGVSLVYHCFYLEAKHWFLHQEKRGGGGKVMNNFFFTLLPPPSEATMVGLGQNNIFTRGEAAVACLLDLAQCWSLLSIFYCLAVQEPLLSELSTFSPNNIQLT